MQLRAILESDNSASACAASTPCLPQLNSYQLAPASGFFAGNAVITNVSPVAYSSSITGASATAGGTCTITYQVSRDGSNFYYWSGSTW